MSVPLDDDSEHKYIRSLWMFYDEAIDDTSDTIQQWDSFESALMDVSGTNTPLVKIELRSKDIAKDVLILLLSGRILPHLHSHLGKVELGVHDEANKLHLDNSLEDIFASTHITLDGETTSLDAGERAEWLLRRSEWWGSLQPWDKREGYARGLLHARAAAAAAAAADAGAVTGPSAADEARGAASGHIPETTDNDTMDEEEAGDEGDAGVDE